MYRFFTYEYKRYDCGNFVDVDKEILLKVFRKDTYWSGEKAEDLKNWLKQKHKAGDMWQWFDRIEVLCLRGDK